MIFFFFFKYVNIFISVLVTLVLLVNLYENVKLSLSYIYCKLFNYIIFFQVFTFIC